MITYKTGDLLREPVDALVNTVNCVGVMGRGIALQFRKAFPKNYEIYRAACQQGDVAPGKMLITERGELTRPRFIVNFPTKRHWRGKSRIEDIESGLVALRHEVLERGMDSIAIPPLGSGLGGLDWHQVRLLIERELSDLSIPVTVFEPHGPPDAEVMSRTSSPPVMTQGQATLVLLVRQYLDGLLDPFVTLLELHKLMYFMQVSGEPLNLRYRKHIYGPYADNLRHVLNRVEGHLISGYADGGDDPAKQLVLVPGAFEDASSYAARDDAMRSRLERVRHLVSGFETPFGLELLATVDWIVREDGRVSAEDVRNAVYGWNARKRCFTPRQIDLAHKRLEDHKWLRSLRNQCSEGNALEI